MSAASVWRPVDDELRRWRAAGRRPVFWLRDDDAVEPGAPLDRLLMLTRRHEIPVALAVIPAHTGAPLSASLGAEPHVTVLVHGWSHENHAPTGKKKQELGHRPIEVLSAELERSLAVLRDLHADRLVPVLVPPWNRVDAALIPSLPALGFEALSTFGPARDTPLPSVNATVDIIDWHATRGCRDHAVLVVEVVQQLREAFEHADAPPIGLLTHHLVHDEAAWDFLENLFRVSRETGAASWKPIRDLI